MSTTILQLFDQVRSENEMMKEAIARREYEDHHTSVVVVLEATDGRKLEMTFGNLASDMKIDLPQTQIIEIKSITLTKVIE